MIESLEDLGLDPGRVRRQRDAYAGIGRAYFTLAVSRKTHAGNELGPFAAATNLRRAGAHSLLLDETEQAKQFFGEAAIAYRAAGAAYGSFVELLVQTDREIIHGFTEVPREAADVWLLWSPDVVRRDNPFLSEQAGTLRRHLEAYRTENVGLLMLPVSFYLDLFDSLSLAGANSTVHAVQEVILPLLGAYAETIRRCRSDSYHWTRLALPFHPAEPDVLGVLIAINISLSARQIPVSRILTSLPIGRDALILVRGILQQYGAWVDE